MKLAIVTDLHANREAVEAVLAHADEQGATDYALLGDYVGYGADPSWVIDTVRQLCENGAVAIMGNHDAAVVNGPAPTMVRTAREVAEWTRSQLDDEQLAFLSSLPMSTISGDKLFVHANAYAPLDWAYVTGRLEAVRSMNATSCHLTFCGHVHEPKLFHLSRSGKIGDFVPTPGVPIALSSQRQWLVIAGSCGQPRDHNPAACYAIHDTDAQALTFHRVPYDHDAAAAKIVAAGLPERLADRLIDGT